MRKYLIAVAVVMISLAVFFAADGGRWTKNLIGNFQGYGDCPNCNDSWSWKDNGSIRYGEVKVLEEGKDYTQTGSGDSQIVRVSAGFGVMICKECLAHPERLDEEKIAQDLRNRDWSEENIKAVKEAVIRYKNERLDN